MCVGQSLAALSIGDVHFHCYLTDIPSSSVAGLISINLLRKDDHFLKVKLHCVFISLVLVGPFAVVDTSKLDAIH